MLSASLNKTFPSFLPYCKPPQTADIAAAPLMIASRRANVVKYSQPYMMAGLRILYKQPDPWNESAPFMLLLRPFTPGLWVVIVILFAGVSVLFFVIGRYSPYEDDQFVGKAATYEGLTLYNSFLYAFSSLTWQGRSSEILGFNIFLGIHQFPPPPPLSPHTHTPTHPPTNPQNTLRSWCDGSSDRSFIGWTIELYLVPASAPRLV